MDDEETSLILTEKKTAKSERSKKKKATQCGTKRRRKTSEQIRILHEYFMRDPCWSKETVDEVVRVSKLSEAQVYKWGWDQKKKRGETDQGFYPRTDEFGGYSKHGFNQLDSIANMIGIDLDQKVEELDLEFLDSLSPINNDKGSRKRAKKHEEMTEEQKSAEKKLDE